jgi:predicted negative regulator of RcsB-dependent stress response
MATHLDLQEQEQLDALRAFWKQYGNLITWTLTAVLAGFALWNGWQWYQRDQGAKAGAMFDEVEQAIQKGELDKAQRLFDQLRDRYQRTVFVPQAALSLARLQLDQNKPDAAQASLTWVTQSAAEPEYQTVAHLRLAGLLMDQKKYDDALKQLDAAKSPAFAGLVADRRGDVLQAADRKPEAIAAYQAAWKALPETLEYRRILEAKLTALAAAPVPAEPAASGGKP